MNKVLLNRPAKRVYRRGKKQKQKIFQIFSVLSLSENDFKSAMSVDLGGIKQILASRWICKYGIANKDQLYVVLLYLN